jgi:hypothetical protein
VSNSALTRKGKEERKEKYDDYKLVRKQAWRLANTSIQSSITRNQNPTSLNNWLPPIIKELGYAKTSLKIRIPLK